MSNRIFYAVIASLPTPTLASAYVAWLNGGHIDAVLCGGASSGEVVLLDPDPSPPKTSDGSRSSPGVESIQRVMAHYVFQSREVFDEYLRVHAPALRAEGLAKFGSSTGVTFQRLVGEIV